MITSINEFKQTLNEGITSAVKNLFKGDKYILRTRTKHIRYYYKDVIIIEVSNNYGLNFIELYRFDSNHQNDELIDEYIKRHNLKTLDGIKKIFDDITTRNMHNKEIRKIDKQKRKGFQIPIKENNYTFYYMVTQDGFGEYEYDYELDDSDYNDFIHNATNVLTGKMSLEEMQELNIKVLDYDSNPIEIIPGQSLVTLNYDQLRDILENNYNDYLSDLDEGDSVILSTEISSDDL